MNLKDIKKNNLRNNKSQLSIFLLISIIIIILFIFLFSSNFENKKNELDKSKTSILSETNSKLFPLKNNVDYCLDRQTKKALIISGMKGGFIYNRGEYYSPSVLLSKTYNQKLIENLNLNWNNLINEVLIYYHYHIYVPEINNNGTIYSRSIKEDYEKFILDEFLNCIDLNRYKDEGYKIIQEDYVSNINNIINSKTFEINKLIGSIGDKVKIEINGEENFGYINLVDIENEKITVEMENPILTNNLDLNEIKVRNINSSIKIIVDFNEENIVSQLYFPIVIKKDEFSTSYKQANSKVNVRFKKYLNLAKLILNEKLKNRSIDYSNNEDLQRVLNLDNYFRNTKLNNIEIIETKINDSDEFKRYVYTIIDEDSKLFGSPYIFNFAYENDAPIIDLSRISGSSFFDDNNIMLIAPKNIDFNMNIHSLVTDSQYYDNYDFRFIPNIKNSNSYQYSIDDIGNIFFKTSINSRFVFNIGVTDGEATRNSNFVFVSGLIENKNNEDTINCLTFKNYEDEEKIFPIDYDYKNKIYSYVDSLGINNVYAYSLIKPNNINIQNSEIELSQSCLGINPDAYDFIVSSNIPSINNIVNNKITIPSSITNPIEITIDILDKNTGDSINNNPFKITIYPAQCLGPKKLISEYQTILGGTGTCCNLDLTPIDRTSITQNKIENLFKDNREIINAQSYFTLDIDNPTSIFPTSYDYTTNIIWDDFGIDSTSIYSGNIIAKCQGTYPKFENNINSISGGSNYINTITKYSIKEKIFNTNIPISLKLETKANICEFSILENYESASFLTNNNLVFNFGFKAKNTNPSSNYIFTIPNSGYEDIYILCDNSNYASKRNNPIYFDDWIKNGNLGLGGSPGTVHTSKGYCYQGSNKCSGRITPLNDYKFESDNELNCKDWSISNGNIFSKSISTNSNWICSEYTDYLCNCDGVDSGKNQTLKIITREISCNGATSYSCPSAPFVNILNQVNCNEKPLCP